MKPDKQDEECHETGKKRHLARDCWSRRHQDKTVDEVEGESGNVDAAQEFVFTIEHTLNDVTLSDTDCEGHGDGLVMIDSRAPFSVCSKWFGETAFEQSDGSVRLRGADGRTLQEYEKWQIWLKIWNQLKRHQFHVVDVTKPIQSVSYSCENGTETHFARQPFLKHGERHEQLIKKSGAHIVKTQVVHEVKGAGEAVMQDKSQQRSCVRVEALQNSQSDVYELKDCKILISHLCELHDFKNSQEPCVHLEKQSSSKSSDAVVQLLRIQLKTTELLPK